ncbi:hypothetical protein M8C21_031505, partial [Ambrosia artemisiifolia]
MPEVITSSTSSVPSPSTSLFNKYAIGKLLGCGAFAKVYHARDIATGRSVAIKIINKQRISHNAHLVANITREVAIMRRLKHPYIVKLYEVMATKTKIYFVMEFVKGGELFDLVAKGRLSESVSRKYFQQLVSAIGYCHSNGVYHRDLKLENLLIDEHGDLKVSDFGLSAVTGNIRADGMLHTLCGTPSYVAPEILMKQGYDGAAADVWSCGIILFVMTAGYLPFNDSNLMMMYKKIYDGEYRCPKWMSLELRQLLSRLLDTNPTTRITVNEIYTDLWFRKGYKEVNLFDDELRFVKGDEQYKLKALNAFDIISFGSGLNLTALFDGGSGLLGGCERVVVAESPENVIGKVLEVVKEVNVRVRKRGEFVVDLVGCNGEDVIGIEVFRLTDRLVVVEVQSCGGGMGFYEEVWSRKIRPELVERGE